MSNRGYVRPANHADVSIISEEMRESDVAEIKASSGSTPEEALRTGLSHSGGRTNTICLSNGMPVGMYGVVPTGIPRVGLVWMLASIRINTVSRQFLRESRGAVQELLEGYDLAFNFTDARNKVHHRWIKWAGFTIFKEHQNFGVERRPFLEFAIIVEKHNV